MIVMEEMLKVFQQHRGDAIVVTGRANRHWDKISTIPNRDLSLGDPAMGGHASFALGLALAQPKRKVIVFDSEGDLQSSLVANLRRFLIELGGDFCFVGENYRLQVGGQDFFVDLVFFHRQLQCLVAIELKVVAFQPEHLGKLEFYLEALDRRVAVRDQRQRSRRVRLEPRPVAGADRRVPNATAR